MAGLLSTVLSCHCILNNLIMFVQTLPKCSSFKCCQIAMDDLHYVAVIDFTKLGCIGQQDINQHAQWMSNVLAKNPLRT